MNIHLNLSDSFHNKTNLTNDKKAFGFSFYPYEVTLPQLVKHIRIGKAFTIGHFSDNRRIESHFISSQLLALDLDQCPKTMGELEEESWFIQEYAFMMYPTPSSTPEQPKTRILFILDEPIRGQYASSRWRVLQLGLMNYFQDVKPDQACKDPSRLFYGCETPNYYVNYIARLPLSCVGGLTSDLAFKDELDQIKISHTHILPRGENDLERCAANYFNHALRTISNAGDGFRHNTLRNYAQWLYGLNAGGWPITKSDIERELTAISRAWGDTDSTIQNNLRWAEKYAKPISTSELKVSNQGYHATMTRQTEQYRKGNG